MCRTMRTRHNGHGIYQGGFETREDAEAAIHVPSTSLRKVGCPNGGSGKNHCGPGDAGLCARTHEFPVVGGVSLRCHIYGLVLRSPQLRLRSWLAPQGSMLAAPKSSAVAQKL